LKKLSVEVSVKKQSLVGLIFILIILVSVEIGIRTYENFSLPCEFVNTDVFKNTDSMIKRSMCLDSIYLQTIKTPITLYQPNQNLDTITINSQGFRGPDFLLPKPSDTFRIFVVGGSTTFGFGTIADDTSIPGFLQQQFNQSEKNVEVINAGIGAAWSFSEKFLIENYIQNYEPDLVVVYDGANDSRYGILSEEKKNTVGFGDFIPSFYRTPYFLNDVVFKIGFSGNKSIETDDAKIKSISSLWKTRMQNICDLGHEKNFSVAIILQPMLATDNRNLIGDEAMFYEQHLDKHGQNAIEIYNIMKSSLNTLDRCTITNDFTNAFDNTKTAVYWDDVHITEQGNEIIAKKMFNLFLPLID
tara:strand:+ start:2196 stop:3269 length:1074 start_codon:yes stop_codon:yes gene_type:complete